MSDRSSERKQQKDDPTRTAALPSVWNQRNLESRVVAVSPGREEGCTQIQPSAIISAQPDLAPTFKANSRVLWSSENIHTHSGIHTGTHLHAHMCEDTHTEWQFHVEETEEV